MITERFLLRCGVLVVDATDDVLRDAAILIEEGRVESVGLYSALRRSYPLATEHGDPDTVALPGFVDAHSHGRGISTVEQGISDAPLEVWLARLTASAMLDPYDQALVAAGDLVSTGVTSAQVFFHSFSGAEEYLTGLASTAQGFKQGGVGLDLVLGITDQHEFLPPLDADTRFPSPVARSLAFPERGVEPETFFELFDALSGEEEVGSGTVLGSEEAIEGLGAARLVLGPVSPQWSSEAIMRGVAERSARGVRVHTHLVERASQRSTLYGPSPLRKLESVGILTEHLSVAHGVWLEPEEISLLAARGVAVVHCPGSNTRLEAGAAPVREMVDAGIPIALGLDSNAVCHPPDVFAEMRHAREVAALRGTSVSEWEALAMATSGGAAAVGRRGEIGTLRPGARADIVLLSLADLSGTHGDPVVAAVNGALKGAVREVWAGGRLLLRQGRLTNSAEVNAARARLHAALRRDGAHVSRRLRELRDLEPWFRDVWDRVPLTVGESGAMGEAR